MHNENIQKICILLLIQRKGCVFTKKVSAEHILLKFMSRVFNYNYRWIFLFNGYIIEGVCENVLQKQT
jgi:hypothetical protein